MSFEGKCKALKLDYMPLHEEIIQQSLLSVGLVLPNSFFMIWCKRCWKFLECAKIKVKQGQKAQIPKKSEGKQNLESSHSDGKVGT